MEGRLKDRVDRSGVPLSCGLEDGLAAAFDFVRPIDQVTEERAHMLANAGPGAEAGVGGRFCADPAPDVLTGPNLMHLLWFVSDSVNGVANWQAEASGRARRLNG
jgi:hypothetical protein